MASIDKSDSCKLMSLLALAAGATAMPQTSNADIIYHDITSAPAQIGYFGSSSFFIDDLPGTAQLIFQAGAKGGSSSISSTRFVIARENNGYVRLRTNAFLAVPANAGLLWNQIAGVSSSIGTAGAASWNFHTPNGFTDKYYAFKFKDSTQGNALRYGWVQVSLFNANLNASEGPLLTIYGWAFDNTGAQIPMGATPVPEPAPMAILALGALMLGAKGLRCWRRGQSVTTGS